MIAKINNKSAIYQTIYNFMKKIPTSTEISGMNAFFCLILQKNLFKFESVPKSHKFWTKVHKLLIFNYPSLKAGVRQTGNRQGFSPKGVIPANLISSV